jgi:hypothetical protein
VTLVSGGNIPEMDCWIKAETATKSRRWGAPRRSPGHQIAVARAASADLFPASGHFLRNNPMQSRKTKATARNSPRCPWPGHGA